MTCRGFIQLLLKVINFLFMLVGLAMIGYGIYMVIIWDSSTSTSPPPPPPPSPPPPSPPPPSPPPPSPPPPPPPPSPPPPSPPPPPPPSPPPPSPPPPSPPPPSPPPPPPSPPPPPPSEEIYLFARSPPTLHLQKAAADDGINVLQLKRHLLQNVPSAVSFSSWSLWSSLPTAWFMYLFIIVGVVITLITCSGYIAAATTNACCLSCYSVFAGIFMIIELGSAAFIFFDDNWQEVIPEESTGELDSIETFIENRIYIFKWVALGAVIVQAFALLLAVILRALVSNPGKDYDSDDEYLPSKASRQPLLNRQAASATGASTAGSDGRPPRTDAWSTRMREKYGLDTTEFSYNPTESKRYPQQASSTEQKKSWCTIM